MQYMKALPVARAKEIRDDGSIVEIIIWQLDAPLAPCQHNYKYRLYYGSHGECRVRYDNEQGKGDHRHMNAGEETYQFVSITQLLADFQADVEGWK
jgi:hypothetical protein